MIEKKNLGLSMLVLFFWVYAYEISASENPYNLSDTLSNNDKVSVVVDVGVYSDKDLNAVLYLLWGKGSNIPKNIIRNLSVTVGNRKSWIRFSAFSDLVNVNSIKMQVKENGFDIIVDGGDTSNHYHANLNFDNEGFLIARRAYSAAFPDEVWEKTQYSYIRRKDM